jgi:predicted nucleic-acid-binding protein
VIGLDTNIVVRYLAQDDPKQSAAASRLFEQVLSQEAPGFVTAVTLCEVAWVLAECYAADRARIRDAIEKLLSIKQIAVETPDLVRRALRAWGASGADFADALIGEVSVAHGADKIVTFDRAAAKLPGFELLQ